MVQDEFWILLGTSVATYMDVQELRQLKRELDLFLERYGPLFGWDEAQDHAQ